MSSRAAPLDSIGVLRPERTALVELLHGLTPADWERSTECPAWDVKGIALHVLGDDFSLLSRQRDVSTDSLSLFAEHRPDLGFRALLDGFNEQWVTAGRFLSTELVVELLMLVGEWSDSFYRAVGLNTIAREAVGFFGESAPSPYWQVIAREFVERFTHQSQIRRAVGAVELDHTLVVTAASVTLHALAPRMRASSPRTGSAISVEFRTFGSWTWRREPEGWTATDGAAPDAGARIVVPAQETVALLTRGLPAERAWSAMAVEGDDTLARSVLEIVVPHLHRH